MKSKVFVVLSHPISADNIGLVARGMKNTGFDELRLVLDRPLDKKAFVTAVHAEDILHQAQLYSQVSDAVADLDVVFAAVARKRKNFPALDLQQAVDKILTLPQSARVGLLFGNERSGLDSKELLHSNFRFSIPQASAQPSYNLAAAVLISLFPLFLAYRTEILANAADKPISRKEQDECIHMILEKLEAKGFIHSKNKNHVTEMVFELFGRLAITSRDKNLLLAMFSKGPDFVIGKSEESKDNKNHS